MKFKFLGLLLLLVFPLLGMLRSDVSPTPTIQHRGYCWVGANGRLNGECLGLRGEICMEAYDPYHCPIGARPKSLTHFCTNKLVDGTRNCTP